MRLHEIKNIHEGSLYERFMEEDELLEEDAKALFAAGKKKLGAAAEKLKDAADAPAQKAWAEIQSRLATAGKEDAIGKLKDFASKNKVAIGTLAILGAGMLFSGDASAADAAGQAAGFAGQAADAVSGGGDAILNTLAQQVQDKGADVQKFMQAMSNVQIDGMGVQDYADQLSQQASTAGNKAQAIQIQQDGIAKIIKATLQGGQQVAQNAQDAQDVSQAGSQMNPNGSSTFTGSDGRKVNFGKGFGDQIKNAVNTARGNG